VTRIKVQKVGTNKRLQLLIFHFERCADRFVCESVNAMDSNTDGKYKHISSHSLQVKCWYLQAVRCLARFSFITAWLIQIKRRDSQ